MFYEEKIENGEIYWRCTPNGRWQLMTLNQLVEKLLQTREELAEAERELQSLKDRFC